MWQIIIGEVEDTRLEAKAKNTKQIRGQGQGQTFRGQTLLRPRTRMLEAKGKEQGHRGKCFPKKKVFKIFFQDNLKTKTKEKVFKIFFRQKRS